MLPEPKLLVVLTTDSRPSIPWRDGALGFLFELSAPGHGITFFGPRLMDESELLHVPMCAKLSGKIVCGRNAQFAAGTA